jgi:serine/threonine-protein kinase
VQFKDDRGLIERFEREAGLMERLKHPNVLEIFRVHRGELPYIVMEILDGGSLRDLLKERKSLPVPECRDLAVQICDALDYTHALKIVHRDIKPENIMVIEGGVAKVMDFGLAKAFEESTMTSVGTILGTYKYMAPEQCMGDPSTAPASTRWASCSTRCSSASRRSSPATSSTST